MSGSDILQFFFFFEKFSLIDLQSQSFLDSKANFIIWYSFIEILL